MSYGLGLLIVVIENIPSTSLTDTINNPNEFIKDSRPADLNLDSNNTNSISNFDANSTKTTGPTTDINQNDSDGIDKS